jgi:hypothetical protein
VFWREKRGCKNYSFTGFHHSATYYYTIFQVKFSSFANLLMPPICKIREIAFPSSTTPDSIEAAIHEVITYVLSNDQNSTAYGIFLFGLIWTCLGQCLLDFLSGSQENVITKRKRNPKRIPNLSLKLKRK